MSLKDFPAVSRYDSTPGPGAYGDDLRSSFGNQYSIGFTIRPRYQEKKSLTANVDYMPLTSTLGGRKSAIGPRYKDRAIQDTAGPEFLPNPKEYFTKSVKIKNRYKDPDTSHLPGPADYSIQDLSGTKVPAMVSRGPIVLDLVPDSPGPAAYSTRSKVGSDTPRTAIRPRTGQMESRDKNPGYTYNQPSRIGSGSPAWTISRRDNSRNSINFPPSSASDYNNQNEDFGPPTKLNGKPTKTATSPNSTRRTKIHSDVPDNDASAFNNSSNNQNSNADSSRLSNRGGLSTSRRSHNTRSSNSSTPGPGAYEITTEFSHKIGPAIRPRTATSRSINDCNAPYENTRRFPEVKQKTIAPQCRTDFTDVATVDCQHVVLQSTLDQRDIKIGLKFPEKTAQPMPGPTDYSPDNPSFRSFSAFSVKGPMVRDDWLPKDLSVPGPGAYDIRSGNNLPKWTIGDKSRLSKTRSTTSDLKGRKSSQAPNQL
ncbi:hypothetical protein TVAG_471340 [Trichomonas vaginalis G3]|uniref:Uncharacterized protein n=1 Tax=Trichomonas vaginalis (strain ATCC PRA-98 / G3) TaxID=412133 RepID=A2FPT3_TRIV3|nr:hypothetical protein TVAGG3_0890570 [Trichomonas vaginalis G3]EAX93076.1 hypothetical protein TVAG_471340 [Trichomonas vaginalis G3]KAI5502694.1 hypothetical protein TVAGG3_0890570 [Trichomonas vaginalis G3]|eukprot:XP_001306006.1 hypothetical protein [Trichomonas vaginalis G3]